MGSDKPLALTRLPSGTVYTAKCLSVYRLRSDSLVDILGCRLSAAPTLCEPDLIGPLRHSLYYIETM